MAKKHIIEFCGDEFAVDSISAATQIVALLGKLKRVSHVWRDVEVDDWHYVPREGREIEVRLKLNQEYREPPKAKKEKPLRLPAPKRGSILCICEKSHVAPRETCPHCGRTFTESHGRTHGADRQAGEQPKLL